ncbi:hypothetical protein [Lacinutrix sp. 5H-3-7-4]|uniref:hypothetical protein n=1 Tax=Lacinutrix sp. (strain 5H-3-7-4) TaxID=983544 RepID=UPI00020A3D92|nr:hypothetical protein [Lacinutrix sp. 5H-3-7-4]AEH02450.1 hypothetical protein Lacal_2609 [Lacinutrix sp. 5H-3-7-4]
MNLPTNSPNKNIALPFVTLSFYNNYFIGIFKEGELVTIEKSNLISSYALDFFKDKPFVYISNRVNSYAVNPEIYPDMLGISNLAGFAVVSKNAMALKNAKFEKMFFKKPFETFNTIDEAIVWTDTLIKEHISNKAI